MAVPFVIASATDTNASTTRTLLVSNGPAAGDTILLCVGTAGVTITSVTDSQGNVYTLDMSASSTPQTSFFRSPGATGGSGGGTTAGLIGGVDTFSVVVSAGTTIVNMVAICAPGVGALDAQSATTSGTNTTANFTATPTQDGDWCILASVTGNAGGSPTLSGTGSANALGIVQTGAGPWSDNSYQILGAGTSGVLQTATITQGVSASYREKMWLFKAPAGGAAAPAPRPQSGSSQWRKLHHRPQAVVASAATPNLNVTAGLATGTGASLGPGIGLTPPISSGTGAAQAVGGGLTSGLSTGAGAVPFAGTGLTAGLATGIGAAQNAQPSFNSNAGLASGTGAAFAPTIGLTAGLPSGIGAAQSVGGGLTSGLATGQGTSKFTAIGLAPGLASGVGAANAPNIGLTSGLATGTGTAQSPQPGFNNNAGLATGTGAANVPGIGLTPGLATGTGAAQQPQAGISSLAGLASGTGAAFAPARGQTPGLPTGTGAAQAVGGGLTSGLSTGAGQVPFAGPALTAGLASGTGSARAPGSGLTPGLATGSGIAQAPTTGLTPAIATGVGTAQAPAVGGSVRQNVDFTGSTLVDPNPYGGTVTVVDTLTGTLTTANTLGGTVTVDSSKGGTLSVDNSKGGTLSVTSDTLTGTLTVAANLLSGTVVTDKMQEVDITLNEFNDVTVTFQIKNNGSPMDITGYTVNALFKKARGDLDNAGTTKTYSSGGGSPKITINTPSTGSCTLAIPEVDMIAPVWTFYRIDIVSGASVQTTAIFGTVAITSL